MRLSKYIESDPQILGGTPVIVGTRVDVYTVAARLGGGDSMQDLISDYPYISEEAFTAAAKFAHTVPRLR